MSDNHSTTKATAAPPSPSAGLVDHTHNAEIIKPKIIGIYGVGGSGKTTAINALKKELGTYRYEYYDGSAAMAKFVQNFPAGFLQMTAEEKTQLREKAILDIRNECHAQGKTGIVAGHLLLWENENMTEPENVWTEADRKTYTHMIYLMPHASIVTAYRTKDTSWRRKALSEGHIHRWQNQEFDLLKTLCWKNDIAFAPFSEVGPEKEISELIGFPLRINEDVNIASAKARLSGIIGDLGNQVETMLVLDGDGTISPQDTGAMFWDYLSKKREDPAMRTALEQVFERHGGYTYQAFHDVAQLYEDAMSEEEYKEICDDVAMDVELYSAIEKLLQIVTLDKTVGAVVLTCGLRRIWEHVLSMFSLDDQIKVIGADRSSRWSIITGEVKAALVAHLQDKHGMFVWAVGDSTLDLGMMKRADQAVVAVGDANLRSRSMERELQQAIEHDGLRARQVILADGAPPRLNRDTLPLIEFDKDEDRHFSRRLRGYREREQQILDATDTNAARLLSTSSRNAEISGLALQKVHRDIGKYLATHFVSRITGVEEYPIPHVQGTFTSGYRFAHEKRTLVVALMRAGEPIAAGVHAAMPSAAFCHANGPMDLTLEYMQGRRTIILADAVINSGTTIAKFMIHIRAIAPTVRIIVVSGVTQAGCLTPGGGISRFFENGSNNYLVTLRKSDNKYTGRGGTDTGHRLFNTTFRD